jgi:hypothetical protein
MAYQNICKLHGGRAPRNRFKAETKRTEAEVQRELMKFGVPVEADPKEVLLRQVHVAHGNLLVLEQLLADVDPEDVADEDPQLRARARGILNLHAEWSDRAAQMSSVAIRAGIEERMVRMAEVQVGTVLKAIQQSLVEIDAPDEFKQQFLQALSGNMRQLGSGS